MIKATSLSIGYRDSDKELYKGLNFTLKKGEITALLGANGAGKSTLIKTLCGFLAPLEGQVFVDGKDLHKMTTSTLSKKVGVVLTDRVANGGLTIYELVSLGRYPHTGFFATLKSNDHKIIKQSLERLNIEHLADKFISQVSDGERQRAMIAKTLAQECKVIILDEPTAFLDAKSRLETIDLLRNIAVEEDKAVLLSTHDLEIIIRRADRLMLLTRKRGLEVGLCEDMILSGAIERLLEDGKESEVKFNRRDGLFSLPNREVKGKVTISGEKKLTTWLESALARNGYRVEIAKESEEANIFFKNNNEIIFNDLNKTYKSIEELLSALKAI